MNYELAKKLKEAGFPQYPSETKVRLNNMRAPGFFLSENNKSAIHNKNLCYIPTLSELIEACGKDFKKLVKDSSPWRADGWNGKELFSGTGKTPEEAVANLWLTLKRIK